jgi:hypothetical protein
MEVGKVMGERGVLVMMVDVLHDRGLMFSVNRVVPVDHRYRAVSS